MMLNRAIRVSLHTHNITGDTVRFCKDGHAKRRAPVLAQPSAYSQKAAFQLCARTSSQHIGRSRLSCTSARLQGTAQLVSWDASAGSCLTPGK